MPPDPLVQVQRKLMPGGICQVTRCPFVDNRTPSPWLCSTSGIGLAYDALLHVAQALPGHSSWLLFTRLGLASDQWSHACGFWLSPWSMVHAVG